MRAGGALHGKGQDSVVRVAVVLDPALAEHVRIRAFQQRVSRSAFLRGLVESDSVAHPVRLVVDAQAEDVLRS